MIWIYEWENKNKNLGLKQQCGRDVDCGRVAEISLLSFLFPLSSPTDKTGKNLPPCSNQHIYVQIYQLLCGKKVSAFKGSSPFPITGFVVLEKPHESSGSTSSVVDLVAKDQPRWTPNLTSNSPPILSFHHRFHWVDVEQMEGVGKVISRLFSWDSIALQSVRLSHFLTFGPTHYCSTCLIARHHASKTMIKTQFCKP